MLHRVLHPLIALLLLAAPLAAQPVESLATRPHAVRGGVLLLPLRLDAAQRWPTDVTLRLADGRRIDGTVAWVRPAPPPARRLWTDRFHDLEVRPLAEIDPPAADDPGGAILLARLPADADGSIRLGRQVIEPRWLDATSPIDPGAPALEVVPGAPDQPDPDSPFAYWRWMLLAERFQAAPPSLDRYGTAGALVAEHDAKLWQAGLDRLAALDVTLAEACRDRLTRACSDGQQTFAAWAADPDQLTTLRTLILQSDVSNTAVADGVRAWLTAQEPVLLWLEAEYPDRIRVTMVNRSREPLIARFTWPGLDDVPTAAELRPGVLTSTVVQRPALPPTVNALPGANDARVEQLRVDVDARTYHLAIPPRSSVARPPAAMDGALRAPLTLAEIETGTLRASTPTDATGVQLRRRNDRWELFFDCRRERRDEPSPQRWTSAALELPLGLEAIVVEVGPAADAVRLTVPEDGGARVLGGDEGDLEVHRRSYSDRWYCRVVLPDAWLSTEPGEPTLFGCARTYGRHGGFQVLPGAATPWRATLGRVAVDLSTWDGLP